jgi:hypothetical protein
MIAAGTLRPDHGPEMPEAISAYLESIPGLNRRHVLQRLREHMDATRTVTATFMGQITDSVEVADNPTQLKAIELALRLHRLIGDDGQRAPHIGTVIINWAGEQPQWNGSIPIDTQAESVPISTVEGTDSAPAAPARTHSASLAAPNAHSGESASIKVSDAPLVQRVKRKRQVRLPVYKGEK